MAQLHVSVILLIFISAPYVNGKTCKKKSSCSCESDEGIMNLKKLPTNGILFENVIAQDGYTYSYNPCKDFSLTDPQAFIAECSDVAVCQKAMDIVTNIPQFYSLGSQSSANFEYVSGESVNLPDIAEVLTVTYVSSQDIHRTGVVSLLCDETTNSVFTATGEVPNTTPPIYRLTLRSKYACFRPAGLSGGSIVLIIFFTLVAVYIIVGSLINKCYRQHKGKEILPQWELWSSTFPSLIKDGFYFTVKRGHYQPINTK